MLVTSDPERDDTPIASFIRLVLAAEDIRKKGDWVTVGNEIQYFWRRGVRGVLRPCHWIYGGEWLVKDIPDPRPWFGNNAMRYAFAACIAEQMAEVFNWRLDRLNVRRDRWTGKLSGQWDPRLPPPQPEHPPSWCAKVGPSPKRRIVDEYRRAHHTRCPEDEYSDIFAKRNLVAKTGFLEFAWTLNLTPAGANFSFTARVAVSIGAALLVNSIL
ncbi:uncharacterized protein BT62DRAFT_919086 [Guyanagaster necrorhizus]|uniref:Uncharacterized protein n=1 Tax=Guyanagaster necrorhizus TaxID=856835 RepID=A0A9P7VUT8_9AGAR|nr:uncharacterized protein BT62DRAFT_919086 [Guyanagaster necrorhizus MCA 3950]KAG7447115.1 hypothetical protein BT62DRAFT_919086 [Guyanagaster necrorhizus MCA 3950]